MYSYTVAENNAKKNLLGLFVCILLISLGFLVPNKARATYQKKAEPKVDVGIVKTVNSDTFKLDETGIFTLTITNYNTATATEVSVFDMLPAGLDIVSVTSTVGSYSTTTNTWVVGNLMESQIEALEIEFSASAIGTFKNQAEATSKEKDEYLPNNKDWVEVEVVEPKTPPKPPTEPKADLAVLKSTDKPQVFVDEQAIFAVTALNNSSSTVSEVMVKDMIPAGLTFISASSTIGNYSTSTGIWLIGTMHATSIGQLILTVTASTTGIFTNVAEISGKEKEKDLSNNKASSTVEFIEKDMGGPTQPPASGGGAPTPSGGGGGGGGSTVIKTADVGIEKSASVSEVNELNNFTFKITATNHGPDTATNVVVTDLLPTSLQFVSASSTSGGSYVANLGAWSIGTLTKDAIAILYIEVKTLEGTASSTIINITSIDALEPDPNATNNQDQAQVHVRAKEVRGEEDKPELPKTGIPVNPWTILLICMFITWGIIEANWTRKKLV